MMSISYLLRMLYRYGATTMIIKVLTQSVALLRKMETVVGDVGDVDGFLAIKRSIDRKIVQFNERLKNHREIIFFVVSST